MFEEFNKKKIIEDFPAPVSAKMYPKEVLEIHNEFNTAAENLLQEAKSIIAEAEAKDLTKVSRLEKLGFNRSSQVTQIKPLLEKARLHKEQVELISYYQREYPLHKFITEEQVKSICNKYMLVLGPVNRYKGFVPEKNLIDIENFKLKKRELDDLPIGTLIDLDRKIVLCNVHSSDILRDSWGITQGGSATFERNNGTSRAFSERINSLTTNGSEYFRIQGDKNQSGLQICAPLKDMDTSGLELVNAYKLMKKHVPDPVVLQPVKGGYLIVTAWGDEASDELVVNQNNN